MLPVSDRFARRQNKMEVSSAADRLYTFSPHGPTRKLGQLWPGCTTPERMVALADLATRETEHRLREHQAVGRPVEPPTHAIASR